MAAASAAEPPQSHPLGPDAPGPEYSSSRLIVQIASEIASNPAMWPLLSCGPARAGSLAVALQQGGSARARQLAAAAAALAEQLQGLAAVQEQEEQEEQAWPGGSGA
jgi:hypothetical protein